MIDRRSLTGLGMAAPLLAPLAGGLIGGGRAFAQAAPTVRSPAISPEITPTPEGEGEPDTSLATTDGRRFVVDYTLEQLEALLDPHQFFRLNRQFIAQLPAVQRLHPHFNGKLLLDLHPAPSDEVLVSREKATAVKSWLEGG